MSVQLGNMAIVSGKKATFGEAPNEGVKAIVIGNESGLTCTITMESGGVQKTLYPSTVDWFAVRRGFSGTILINPVTILNNVSTFPASSLIFDAIGLDDPEEASMYPLALPRNTNIGNSVATVGGSTTSVTNDNQPLTPSNVFIEATPANAAGSTFSIATDGAITIKGDVANTLTTLIQTVIAAAAGASSVKLGDAARAVEILGSLLVDTTLTVTGAQTLTGNTTHTGTVTVNGAGTGLTVTNNELVSGTLTVTGAASLNGDATVPNVLNVTNNGIILKSGGNTILNTTSNVALNAPTGQHVLLTVNGGGVIDGTGTNVTFIGGSFADATGLHAGSGNAVLFSTGSFTGVSRFTGTGNGTVATGITSPFSIMFDPCTVSGSSQTIGGTVASSSVVTTGAGLAWHGTAYN